MIRKVSAFADKKYDLIIVGGGIYGISVARDAALRGLTVGLVEQGDFGNAASSNHHKIIHGGFRYLQHADFSRMRESSRERNILMRIAPHLVHPMPCVIPTYGHRLREKLILTVALKINDVISFDRNRKLPRAPKNPRWPHFINSTMPPTLPQYRSTRFERRRTFFRRPGRQPRPAQSIGFVFRRRSRSKRRKLRADDWIPTRRTCGFRHTSQGYAFGGGVCDSRSACCQLHRSQP